MTREQTRELIKAIRKHWGVSVVNPDGNLEDGYAVEIAADAGYFIIEECAVETPTS